MFDKILVKTAGWGSMAGRGRQSSRVRRPGGAPNSASPYARRRSKDRAIGLSLRAPRHERHPQAWFRTYHLPLWWPPSPRPAARAPPRRAGRARLLRLLGQPVTAIGVLSPVTALSWAMNSVGMTSLVLHRLPLRGQRRLRALGQPQFEGADRDVGDRREC